MQQMVIFLVSCFLICSELWAESGTKTPQNGSKSPNSSARQPILFEPDGTKNTANAATKQSSTSVDSGTWESKNTVVTMTIPTEQYRNREQLMNTLRTFMVGASREELIRMTWQMATDSAPIPPDLGGIFVPNLVTRTDVAAPSYTVFDRNNRPVAITETGKKSFVYPGVYTVRIGRVGNDMLPTFTVTVERGKMTLIRVKWAALIVRVVDERLIQFRGTYDLIHLNSRRVVGTGIGADDELGEKVRPWLLPPGLYMVVRVGDNYLARTNYFTVQVDEGKVTTFRLVVDKNTGQFLGGGVLLLSSAILREGAWRLNLQLSGNFLLSYTNNFGGVTDGLNFSMAAFLFSRVQYNEESHFFSATLNAELGFTFSSQGLFRKGADRFELQTIYAYRVLSWLGPYARATFETVMLPDWWQFPNEEAYTQQDVSIYHCTSAACQLQKMVKVTSGEQLQQIQLNGVFDPTLLKQGVGVNIQPVRTSWVDLRLLFGIGFRQQINRDVFQFDPKSDVYTSRCKNANPSSLQPADLKNCPNANDQEKHTSVLLQRKEFTHREGLEMAMVATGSLSRFITYTFEIDALLPFEFSERATFINLQNFEIDGRLTVIFRLSHYASLNFRLRIRRDPTLPIDPLNPELSRWSIDMSNALSFSLLF